MFGDVIGCLESVVSFCMQDCHLEMREKKNKVWWSVFLNNILRETQCNQVFLNVWKNLIFNPKIYKEKSLCIKRNHYVFAW